MKVTLLQKVICNVDTSKVYRAYKIGFRQIQYQLQFNNKYDGHLNKMKSKQIDSELIWNNHEFLGKYGIKFKNCKSKQEVYNIFEKIKVNENIKYPQLIQYNNGIRSLAQLKEFDECFKLFEYCKTIHKPNALIYSTMLWICSLQRNK